MSFTKESKLYDLFHKDKNYVWEAASLRIKYPEAKTVLEIGAGTGRLTKAMVALGFKVVAVEPSKEMLSLWRCKGVVRVNEGVQDLAYDTWNKNQFDLVVAHYDVLNYLNKNDYVSTAIKIKRWGKKHDIEMWDKKRGVKLFTYKKSGSWRRVRLGIRIGDTAHLLFIFFGRGFIVEKHTLHL